jgi:hypothetical protein
MNGEAGMHYRDDKPIAATAIFVRLFLVSAVWSIIKSTYEPNIGHRPPATSAPLWVMAGK